MTMEKETRAVNIPYIYTMHLLRRQRLHIKRRYLFLVAGLFCGLVLLQIIPKNGVTDIDDLLRYLVLFVSNYFFWVFLIEYIYGTLQDFQRNDRNLLQRLLEVFISFSVLVIVHLIITNLIYYSYLLVSDYMSFSEVWNDFRPFIMKSVLSRFLDLFIIVVLLKLFEAYWAFQKKKLEVVNLESQLRLSQLDALRAQLDPHFLFNSLHTLHSLIGYDDQKAKSMLIKVTALMRKTLDQQGKYMIPLEDELEYIQNYLDIEKERFHDRLEVSFMVEEESKLIMVPSLILQPLLENAFKHGISLMEAKGEVSITSKIENNSLILMIKNSIPGQRKHSEIPSTGIGLKNVEKRLEEVYGENAIFSSKEEDSFYKVSIIIKTLEKL